VPVRVYLKDGQSVVIRRGESARSENVGAATGQGSGGGMGIGIYDKAKLVAFFRDEAIAGFVIEGDEN
jgi:hypothetical protein